MMKHTGLLGVVMLGLLAACSKTPAPDAKSAAEASAATAAAMTDDEQAPPATAEPSTEAPVPAMDPSKKAAALMSLIADGPQCASFRTELETAGSSPTATGDQLNEIVARAGAAGCTKVPSKP